MVFFVFILVLALGLFVVSTRVAELSQQRIQLQVAADAAAMAGTRAQDLGLGFMTMANDKISYHFGRLMADIPNPVRWPDIPEQICAIESLKKAQDRVGYLTVAFAEGATIAAGIANDAGFCFAHPTKSSLSLNLHRPWYLLTLFEMRNGGEWTEKVVSITSTNFSPSQTIDSLIGFSQKNVQGYAASSPFYVFQSDPRSNDLGVGWQMICMFIPGPFWQNRLVGIESIPASSNKMIDFMEKGTQKVMERQIKQARADLLEAIAEEDACEE